MKQVGKRTAPRVAPYAFAAPAAVLYALALLVPIGYTLYLSVEKTQVSGLGLGLGTRRQVFAATLQVFNEPQTLLPLSNTISPDWMPLMRVYDLAFNQNNSYQAAALSVLIAAVMFAGSFALLRAGNKRVFQGR